MKCTTHKNWDRDEDPEECGGDAVVRLEIEYEVLSDGEWRFVDSMGTGRLMCQACLEAFRKPDLRGNRARGWRWTARKLGG